MNIIYLCSNCTSTYVESHPAWGMWGLNVTSFVVGENGSSKNKSRVGSFQLRSIMCIHGFQCHFKK